MSDGNANQNTTGQMSTGNNGATTQGSGGAGSNGSVQQTNVGGSEWFSGFNDDLKGYVQTKGFKDPAAVTDAYRNLEKVVGAPPERILKLPEKLEDQALMPIFDKLGRPEKAEGYNIKPEAGGDENFIKFAQGMFHEVGLTKSQGEKLAAKWDEYIQGQNKSYVEQHTTKVQQENESLKKEWGQAYNQNVEIGRNAVAKFGIDKETLDKLENVMGFAGLIKFAHSLGKGLGEDNFIGPDSKTGGFGIMTPQQAQHRIKQLGSDQEWVRRYSTGGAAEKAEMERLHKMAFPETA